MAPIPYAVATFLSLALASEDAEGSNVATKRVNGRREIPKSFQCHARRPANIFTKYLLVIVGGFVYPALQR
jgi:hypothetical protein